MVGRINRLVVKFGTENLSTEKRLDPERFSEAARQIMKVKKQGIEVAIVTSGAIRAGEEIIRELGGDPAEYDKQDLAAVGSSELLNKWRDAFKPYKKVVKQIWITHQNWEDLGERVSVKLRILNSFKNGLSIPLINENDAIADLEIKWMEEGISENDRLAARIAILIEANAILFLTDEAGVYEEDPKKNPKARLYEEISAWTNFDELLGISKDASEGGTGGMKAKLEAACQCVKEGMRVAIAGGEKDTIIKFVEGASVGTKVGGITTKFKIS